MISFKEFLLETWMRLIEYYYEICEEIKYDPEVDYWDNYYVNSPPLVAYTEIPYDFI